MKPIAEMMDNALTQMLRDYFRRMWKEVPEQCIEQVVCEAARRHVIETMGLGIDRPDLIKFRDVECPTDMSGHLHIFPANMYTFAAMNYEFVNLICCPPELLDDGVKQWSGQHADYRIDDDGRCFMALRQPLEYITIDFTPQDDEGLPTEDPPPTTMDDDAPADIDIEPADPCVSCIQAVCTDGRCNDCYRAADEQMDLDGATEDA